MVTFSILMELKSKLGSLSMQFPLPTKGDPERKVFLATLEATSPRLCPVHTGRYQEGRIHGFD